MCHTGQFWAVLLGDLLKAALSQDSFDSGIQMLFSTIIMVLIRLLVNTCIFPAELVCRVFFATYVTFARFCLE